jgi:asparagine synthetase B (glutamine-hydrolysing)
VISPLSDLEMACGLVLGVDRRPAPLPSVPAGLTPLEALESAILPALRRPPCLVSFSGGRDSSAVLAVATALARREALADPIPATNRFADAPASDEAHWQERIVDHLGLADWVRLEFTDELDAVGPYAQQAMRRHGLLWPFNAHFHLPLLEAAAGGSLLTGIGGDELFMAACPPRAYAVLTAQEPPQPRDVLTVGLAVAPRPLRRVVHRRRLAVPFAWLSTWARRALARVIADEEAREPLTPAARLRLWHALRSLRIGCAAVGALGRDHDVLLDHPFAAPEVAAAVARAFPRGFRDRTMGMRALFDDLLPDEILGRRSKAHFDEAFFHRHSRAFEPTWDGDGVPADVVDVATLRREWRSSSPAPQSLTLLQAAWLARERRANGSAGELVHESRGGLLERAPTTRPTNAQERQRAELEQVGRRVGLEQQGAMGDQRQQPLAAADVLDGQFVAPAEHHEAA